MSRQSRKGRFGCLTRNSWLTSRLRDLTPYELGQGAATVRNCLTSLNYREVLLNPFDNHPIDYSDNVLDLSGAGQLRFNTEPEIWSASKETARYYSIGPLFRREAGTNPLRRLAFFLVDFYQPGPPELLLPVFRQLLDSLGRAGLAVQLSSLPFEEIEYDPVADGPRIAKTAKPKWLIAYGYDSAHSLFEIDAAGVSSRRELFLITPRGFLEIAAFGLTGWNHNPNYRFRSEAFKPPKPDLGQSGMGIGLERLLLAEQIISL